MGGGRGLGVVGAADGGGGGGGGDVALYQDVVQQQLQSHLGDALGSVPGVVLE